MEQKRKMRRALQELSRAESEEILRRGSCGVLALQGDDGYPYTVPLSYCYEGGRIYFHCAKAGYKLDCIARSPKAGFCVVDKDDVIPEKYTTAYRSVIAAGRVRVMQEESAARAAAAALGRKYHPAGTEEELQAEISGAWERLCLLEMEVETLTGKQGRELMQAQKG